MVWKKLCKAFPEMVAAVLMPNHAHLLLPAETEATRKIAGVLASTSVYSGLKFMWQPIPHPRDIPDLAHLRRQIRYVALNPCRKKLCDDPLAWSWSTYRDVMGGIATPIQNEQKLAKILKDPTKDFLVRFHAYVSGDPSVSISGTAFPKRQKPQNLPEQSIGEILNAAASSLRMQPDQIRSCRILRKMFVHLAYRHGWRRATYLADICGVTKSTVHYMLKNEGPKGIEAAELCLGDRRLRGNVSLEFLTNSMKRASTEP